MESRIKSKQLEAKLLKDKAGESCLFLSALSLFSSLLSSSSLRKKKRLSPCRGLGGSLESSAAPAPVEGGKLTSCAFVFETFSL